MRKGGEHRADAPNFSTDERRRGGRRGEAAGRAGLASCRVALHIALRVHALHAYEANTVLEVLEIRAEQIGLPKTAAAFLEMEFPDRFHRSVVRRFQRQPFLCPQDYRRRRPSPYYCFELGSSSVRAR